MNSAAPTTLELLARLVAFPTVSARSNLEMIDFISDFLSLRGFEVHRIPAPGGQKAGLFARIGPSGPAGILLSGHTDVVPTEGQAWRRDPFRLSLEQGRAFGRGSTDMKGFLAAMLSLADRAARTRLRAPLLLAFSYDEELGCRGIQAMIERLVPAIGLPRLALIGEPTSMRLALGHKGKAVFRATCRGRAGHSALAPELLNALHLAAGFVTALHRLQDELARNGARDPAYRVAFSTLHPGRLHAGTALNIVPDRARVDFELRHLAAEPPEAVLARIETAAQRIAAPFRPDFPEALIELERLGGYPALDTDENDEAVAFIRKISGPGPIIKVDFGTEAGVFSQALGIPSLICGPGSMARDGHRPDESIALAQLAACDAMLERLLGKLAADPAG